MGKIAVAVEQALARRAGSGAPGRTDARLLASGDGWRVQDVVCSSGPGDRPFEECHTGVSIAVVAAGTFQYRSAAGRALMTPGSLLLGSPGQRFECGHEHGAGDRCVAFSFTPDYVDRVSVARWRARLRAGRLPPLRQLAPVVARACAGLSQGAVAGWEEIGVELAGRAVELAGDPSADAGADARAEARVTRIVREIERRPGAGRSLAALADEAGLSPYHFLRTFRRITGVTPHQFLVRLRLRDAALRLVSGSGRIIDVALDAGFGDLSNFNRAFRVEFGAGPREYRRRGGRRPQE